MNTGVALSAALETALNLYLQQDPQAMERCAALTDRVIAIDLTVPGVSLYFLPDAQGIQVLSHYEGEVDTRLTGSPLGFARLSLGKSEDALFAGTVRIDGDTEIGQKFQDLLAGTDWDWEEQVSRFIGDIVAHQLGNAVRRMQRFVSESRATLEQDVGEYLQEEARLLPVREEVAGFLEQVDVLRSAADRLAARVQRLLELQDPAR